MNEPSTDALLAQSSLDGWDFFAPKADPDAEKLKAALSDERGMRMSAIAAALYEVPEFRELLEFMLDKSLRRVTFMTQLGIDPMQAYCFGSFREGQNAMAFMITKLIAEGQKITAPKERD